MNTKLSLYYTESDWDESYEPVIMQRWRPPVVLVLNPKRERIARLFALLPESLIIPRNHPLSEQHDDMHRDPEGTGVRHARELHEYRLQVAPDVPADRVILLGINEPEANPAQHDGQAVQHIVRYTVARFREHARLGDRGGGPDFGITWPSYGDWASCEAIHQAARAHNCVLTFHRYWRGDLGLDHEWDQWAGEWPPDSWGDIPWIITECGDDGLLADRKGGPSGWQDVLPGPAYVGQMATFDGRLRKRANVLGACVFLWGELSPWNTYNIRRLGPAIAEHAEATRREVEVMPEIEIMPVLRRPVDGPVTQEFGQRLVDYSRFGLYAHNGRDYGAPGGAPVLAAHGGQCWVYDDPAGYGRTVEIWCPSIGSGALYKTIYAHLLEQAVRHGQTVAAGDFVGRVGSTGNSTGPHLHFSLKILRNGADNPGYRGWIDPRGFMER